jgi:hypothetical protein
VIALPPSQCWREACDPDVMLRWLVVILTSACGAPAATPPLVPLKVVPVTSPPEVVVGTPVAYVAPIENPVRRYCPASTAPAPAPVATGKTKVYDFTAIPIDARLGYSSTTQPRASYARDPEAIRTAITRETPRMADCMRVARGARMRTSGLLDVFVELDVDPFGAISNVTVDAPRELEGCLRATLLAVRVPHQAPRTTHASVRLDFTRIGNAGSRKDMPAARPTAPVRGHCFLAGDPLPVDEPTLGPVEIDFDPPPPAVRPSRGGRYVCRGLDVDKLQIRRAVMAIHGDLRACYLDALARQPDLQGTVSTQFVLGTIGELTQIAVSGAGDDALHTCMADALAATAAASEPEGPVTVNMPFTLLRSTTGADRETAAAGFAERARTATTADGSCRARAALVGAYLGADAEGALPLALPLDPRVMPALESLVAFVAANSGASLAACLDELAPVLVRLGHVPLKNDEPERLQWSRGKGLAEAIERSQRIVELFPQVERALLPFIADGLAVLDDHDAARDAYLRFLSLGNDDPTQVMHAADGYARVTRNRDEHLLWDDCPR